VKLENFLIDATQMQEDQLVYQWHIKSSLQQPCCFLSQKCSDVKTRNVYESYIVPVHHIFV